MSTRTATLTGVVEQMLGHVAAGRWDALRDVLGKRVKLPVVELLEVADNRVSSSEVFVSDTAALLGVLSG
jgi:hypothetical protein